MGRGDKWEENLRVVGAWKGKTVGGKISTLNSNRSNVFAIPHKSY